MMENVVLKVVFGEDGKDLHMNAVHWLVEVEGRPVHNPNMADVLLEQMVSTLFSLWDGSGKDLSGLKRIAGKVPGAMAVFQAVASQGEER